MEINNQADLKMAILALEKKNAIQKELLIEQFHITHESLRPINIIKNAVNGFVNTDVTGNVIDGSIGLAAGFLSKKILIGRSSNIFKKVLGNVIELGIANVVSKNSGGIKEAGLKLFRKFIKPKNETAD